LPGNEVNLALIQKCGAVGFAWGVLRFSLLEHPELVRLVAGQLTTCCGYSAASEIVFPVTFAE
jgi:hypothetical protein